MRENQIDETTREGGPAGTVREGGPAKTIQEQPGEQHIRINLPPDLAARFAVVGELRGGGEADVLIVRRTADGPDGPLRVLKVYRPGFEPDPEALRLIQGVAAAHVVQVFDSGDSPIGRWEEQEYVPLGSLEELFAKEAPLPRELLDQVIEELTSAVEAVPVLHRDLKPSNILVRSREPLDLVLADFGLARSAADLSHIISRRSGSPAYESPEAMHGSASHARDWWAVGMIVAEAALGHHPYYEPGIGFPPQKELEIALSTRPVPLDGLDDQRIRLLCRGLLVRDPDRRWGKDQIRAWQRGESPPVADDAPASRPPAVQPIVFAGHRCSTPEELAPLLADHWDDALRLIGGEASEAPEYVRLVEWLHEHDQVAAIRVLDSPGRRERSYARRLFRLIRALDPALPPTFRRRVIDHAGLLALARQGAAGDVDAGSVLYDIQSLGIVGELAREGAYDDLLTIDDSWKAQTELLGKLREQLGAAGKPLDNQEASRAANARILAALLDAGAMQELVDQVEAAAREPALAENENMRKLFRRVLEAPAAPRSGSPSPIALPGRDTP